MLKKELSLKNNEYLSQKSDWIMANLGRSGINLIDCPKTTRRYSIFFRKGGAKLTDEMRIEAAIATNLFFAHRK